MKGIILAGGSGTRLYPSTISVSKQLIPIFDKPLIYYPLCTLMQAGIREILIICNPKDIFNFQNLFGNGESLGLKLFYKAQEKPKGIAEAFIIGEEFIDNQKVALILGDNIFYGIEDEKELNFKNFSSGARIFAYNVPDPSSYGVLNFKNNKIISIDEKPLKPKSHYAVTGLYFYDKKITKVAKQIKPSKRNELEITDINNIYIKEKKCSATFLNKGVVWLDAGTHTSLLQASQFVQTIQERKQISICCPEEIALEKKYIDLKKFKKIALAFPKNAYGSYLRKLLKEYS